MAFALIGIVTLQLGLLKLNSGIGRALERKESLLQRENAALSIENSELAGRQPRRVPGRAARHALVPVGGLQFLDSHARSDVPQAAAALQARRPAPKRAAKPTSAGSSSAKARAKPARRTVRQRAANPAAASSTGSEASASSDPARRSRTRERGRRNARVGSRRRSDRSAGAGRGTAAAESRPAQAAARPPRGARRRGGRPAPHRGDLRGALPAARCSPACRTAYLGVVPRRGAAPGRQRAADDRRNGDRAARHDHRPQRRRPRGLRARARTSPPTPTCCTTR